MGPENKVIGLKIGIVSALQLLQARLGETQEGMARRLGCTLGAWSKWFRGERTPSGEWLLRILALCPDEETLKNFLDIGEIGSKLPLISEVPIEKKEAPRAGGVHADVKFTGKYRPKRP